jgi:hypothetical protein
MEVASLPVAMLEFYVVSRTLLQDTNPLALIANSFG